MGTISDIKRELFFKRLSLIKDNAIKKGLILPIEEEVYARLHGYYFNGLPIDMHLRYLRPLPPMTGNCLERSAWLTLGLSGSTLVRGNTKNLELLYGKTMAEHGWVEYDGWVYDPTILCKFRRDVYYKMLCPSEIERHEESEYKNTIWYQGIENTTLDDLKPHGRLRPTLATSIVLYRHICEHDGNSEFQSALNQHLKDIDFDLLEVQRERDALIEETLSKKDKGML